MRDRYTESNPDVVNAKAQLEQLKKDAKDAAHEAKQKKPDSHPVMSASESRERLDAESRIQQLQALIRAKDAEAAGYQKEIASVSGSIRQYQGRIESQPVGEKEYNDLIRDRDLAKTRYQGTLKSGAVLRRSRWTWRTANRVRLLKFWIRRLCLRRRRLQSVR